MLPFIKRDGKLEEIKEKKNKERKKEFKGLPKSPN